MTDLREALEQLRLDQPAHAEAEEYWLLPSAFNSVLAAARAYADLLDGFPSPEAVEAAAAAIYQSFTGLDDWEDEKIYNPEHWKPTLETARAALMAAATTDFGKEADGD